MFPDIIGIACTDQDGRLFFEDEGKKKLITRSPGVPKWVGKLDFAILQRFLLTHWNQNSVVVIGDNTYRQAKKLIHSHMAGKMTTLIISTANDVTVCRRHESGSIENHEPQPYPSENTLQGLRLVAYQAAIDTGAPNIIVLGGHSVYRAFANRYHEFTDCQVETSLPDSDDDKYLLVDSLLDNPQHWNMLLEEGEYSVRSYTKHRGGVSYEGKPSFLQSFKEKHL